LKKIYSLLKAHLLKSLHPDKKLIKNEEFPVEKKSIFFYEVEKFSEFVNVRHLYLGNLTSVEVVQQAIKELEKHKDFVFTYTQFEQSCIQDLGTVRWTEQLEFDVTRLLQGEHVLSLEAHCLIKQALDKRKSTELWRKTIDVSLVPVLCNQPCKLREPRTDEWPKNFSSEPFSIWIRSTRGWMSTENLEVIVQEPEEFKHAITFSSVPQHNLVLALNSKDVSFGVLGELKSRGSFAHDVEDANFIDCYMLPSKSIVVRVGQRNCLTGGMLNESMYSFMVNTTPTPCSLSSEEELLVETISSINSEYPWTLQDISSVLTGWNDLAKGVSKVIYKTCELELSNSLVLATIGHPGDFYAVFFNGDVLHYVGSTKTKKLSASYPLTHAVVNLKH
jgi:hypothetical protein